MTNLEYLPSAPLIEADEIPPPSYTEALRGVNLPQSEGQENSRFSNGVVPVHLKLEPTRLVCPYCFEETTTFTEKIWSEDTHALGSVLFLVCLCWLAFYLTKPNIDHYCSECRQYIGIPYEQNPLLKNEVEEIRREVEGVGV